MIAVWACSRSRWTTPISVSAPKPPATSALKSRALSSASRVISHAELQHSVRGSGSAMSPIRSISVASEPGSRRSAQ